MAEATLEDLLKSHAELREALIFAWKRIKQLRVSRANDPALPILRRVLRDSRKVVKRFGEKVAIVNG